MIYSLVVIVKLPCVLFFVIYNAQYLIMFMHYFTLCMHASYMLANFSIVDFFIYFYYSHL